MSELCRIVNTNPLEFTLALTVTGNCTIELRKQTNGALVDTETISGTAVVYLEGSAETSSEEYVVVVDAPESISQLTFSATANCTITSFGIDNLTSLTYFKLDGSSANTASISTDITTSSVNDFRLTNCTGYTGNITLSSPSLNTVYLGGTVNCGTVSFASGQAIRDLSVAGWAEADANAVISSMWDAYADNVPSRGTLTTPTLSGEAANIAAILQDFYGWTLNGVPLWQIVSTVADIEAINEGLAGNYKLANDIDFASEGIYTSAIIAGTFTGKLNLNAHAIKNFVIENTEVDAFLGLFQSHFGAEIYGGEISGDVTALGGSQAGYCGIVSGGLGSVSCFYNLRIGGSIASGARCAPFGGAYASVVCNCAVSADVTASNVSFVGGITAHSGGGIVANCVQTGKLTGVAAGYEIIGGAYATPTNCFWTDEGHAGYITAAEMADPATYAYSGTPDAWADDTEYLVGDIVGDGTYAYIATEPSTGVHPSTLIGWKRLGFDFDGTRQGNGYDYGLVIAGEVWPGTATQIPQADGSYLDLATGERVVNTTGDNWTVVDLREVWKMVAGEPVLRWERFGGARSRMSGIAFDLRNSRTTGGARVV